MFKGTLSGSALAVALDAEIARTVGAIAAQLAPYDPAVTPQSWHRILQGAEELINLLFETLDDEELRDAIAGMSLARAIGPAKDWLQQSIRNLYDGGIEIRILEVLQLVFALDGGCAAHGQPLGLATVADAVGYLHIIGLRLALTTCSLGTFGFRRTTPKWFNRQGRSSNMKASIAPSFLLAGMLSIRN